MNGKSGMAVTERNPLKWKEHLQKSFGGEMRNKQKQHAFSKFVPTWKLHRKDITAYILTLCLLKFSAKKNTLTWEIAVTVEAATTHCQRLYKPVPQRIYSLAKTALKGTFMFSHCILHGNSWGDCTRSTPQLLQQALLKTYSSNILNCNS